MTFATTKLVRPTVGSRIVRPLIGILIEAFEASRKMAVIVAFTLNKRDFGLAGFGSPLLDAESLVI